jgi:anti-anti-sigma regulatory factor
MFRASLNKGNTVLEISFSGIVPVEEVRRGAEQMESLLAEIHSGFRLLTDLSHLDSMDVAAVPVIDKMMDLFNRRGVDTVVRVIPDPHKDIGLSIMSLFHYRRQVRIVTCETLAEAEKILAK